MCIGSVADLVDTWEDGAACVGRLSDGRVVPLSFVPHAAPGDQLLLHLGIPVEVLPRADVTRAVASFTADENGELL
jgi:hypothetical protein